MLASVLRHVLLQTLQGTPCALFGEAAPFLRQAILLASVCKEWRYAATLASQALAAELDLDLDVVQHTIQEAEALSPLLSELLPGLPRLRLAYTALAVPTVAQFLERVRPSFLGISVSCPNQNRRFKLAALETLLAGSTSVELHLWECAGLHPRACRSLWRALAPLPPLTLLRFDDVPSGSAIFSVSDEQLLASVSCKELALSFVPPNPGFVKPAHLLPALRCESFYCMLGKHVFCSDMSRPFIRWSWELLTSRTGGGVFVLEWEGEVSITGCPGTLPQFAQGWALVLACPFSGVLGLPLDHFTQGPRDLRVWQNRAVSDATLERAYELLLDY